MSPGTPSGTFLLMSGERSGVEHVLRAVDVVRGSLFLALAAGVAIAAFRAGGVVGWLLGALLLVGCLLVGRTIFRRIAR
jgi:hypothetical protein